mmetsp:Transcript_42444/g.72446  ORF Transcript_42444/g.72446 Transcript_42444/m.72446 type:complete len:267 (-) Transcript_42444:472-1272(-)
MLALIVLPGAAVVPISIVEDSRGSHFFNGKFVPLDLQCRRRIVFAIPGQQVLARSLVPLLGFEFDDCHTHWKNFTERLTIASVSAPTRLSLVGTVIQLPIRAFAPKAEVYNANASVWFKECFDFVTINSVAWTEGFDILLLCFIILLVFYHLVIFFAILRLSFLFHCINLFLLLFLLGLLFPIFHLDICVAFLLAILFLLLDCCIIALILLLIWFLCHRNILDIQTQMTPVPHLPPIERDNPSNLATFFAVDDQFFQAFLLSGLGQ